MFVGGGSEDGKQKSFIRPERKFPCAHHKKEMNKATTRKKPNETKNKK